MDDAKVRWQRFFEKALEERGLPPDATTRDMANEMFAILSKRADKLLADDEGRLCDAAYDEMRDREML